MKALTHAVLAAKQQSWQLPLLFPSKWSPSSLVSASFLASLALVAIAPGKGTVTTSGSDFASFLHSIPSRRLLKSCSVYKPGVETDLTGVVSLS